MVQHVQIKPPYDLASNSTGLKFNYLKKNLTVDMKEKEDEGRVCVRESEKEGEGVSTGGNKKEIVSERVRKRRSE